MDRTLKMILEHNFITKWNIFRQLNELAAPGGTVFAGDSITEGFYIHEFFPKQPHMYNRGISGISSTHLLQHMDEHILQLAPAKVFLLIGTNDFEAGEPVDAISQRIRNICCKIQTGLPACKVYVESVYPVNEKLSPQGTGGRNDKDIRQLNEMIWTWAAAMEQVEYLNIYPLLADEDGLLQPEYTYDGLHLTAAGYQKITEFIKEKL